MIGIERNDLENLRSDLEAFGDELDKENKDGE